MFTTVGTCDTFGKKPGGSTRAFLNSPDSRLLQQTARENILNGSIPNRVGF